MEPDEEVKKMNLDGELVRVKEPTPREQFTKVVKLLREAEPFIAEATREMNKVSYQSATHYGIDVSSLEYAAQRLTVLTAMLSELLDKDGSRE